MTTASQHNFDRKKNVEQKQWLLSLPDEQREKFKSYLLDKESICAIIKKFRHTYGNIFCSEIQKMIVKNSHITIKKVRISAL